MTVACAQRELDYPQNSARTRGQFNVQISLTLIHSRATLLYYLINFLTVYSQLYSVLYVTYVTAFFLVLFHGMARVGCVQRNLHT